MKVVVYPADETGCGYYRLIWPALYLKSLGHDISIVKVSSKNRVTGMTNEAGELVSVSAPRGADVLVFQRVTSKFMIDAVPAWRSRGIAVVVDIDDDLSTIHPGNPMWNVLHPTTGGKNEQYDWHNAQRFCEAATYVTTSTEPLLKKYAPTRYPGDPSRGVVLYNCVPEAVTRILRNPIPGTFGWGGTVRTHPDDPPVVGRSIAGLQRDGYDFRVVGPSPQVKTAFNLVRDPVVTGGVPLGNWFHELSRLSVGIAPLAATKFNDAKSWLKMLEYSALGIPAVGSPRAEYRRLHAHGIGLLADSPKDWYRHIRRLMGDETLRTAMGEAAREIVRAQFTIESNAWRWWEAWQTALRLQRGSSGGASTSPLLSTTGQKERGPQTS